MAVRLSPAAAKGYFSKSFVSSIMVTSDIYRFPYSQPLLPVSFPFHKFIALIAILPKVGSSLMRDVPACGLGTGICPPVRTRLPVRIISRTPSTVIVANPHIEIYALSQQENRVDFMQNGEKGFPRFFLLLFIGFGISIKVLRGFFLLTDAGGKPFFKLLVYSLQVRSRKGFFF